MKPASLLFLCFIATAQVDEPRAGAVRTAAGEVRIIAGLPGAFVAGEIVAAHALDAADSGRLRIAKLDTSLLAGGGEFPTPPGRAVIGFSSDGRTAYVYFPGSSTFARITAEGIEPLPLDPAIQGSEVLAIRDTTLFIRREDGVHAVSINAGTGAIDSDTPLLIAADVMAATPGALVYAAAGALVVLEDGGIEHRLPVSSAVTALARMGDGWIHVRDEARSFALRLRDAAPALYELPEPEPGVNP